MPTPIRLNRIVTSTWISHHSLVSDSWYLSIAWRGYLEGLNRLLNKLRHNLHHIGYLAYLLQRLMWQPTIALSTFDLTYHTSIIELIVINSTRLIPAWKSEAYRGLLTLPNVFIIQTHHAQAETILFDRGSTHVVLLHKGLAQGPTWYHIGYRQPDTSVAFLQLPHPVPLAQFEWLW